MNFKEAQIYLKKTEELVEYVLPFYQSVGKYQISVAIAVARAVSTARSRSRICSSSTSKISATIPCSERAILKKTGKQSSR